MTLSKRDFEQFAEAIKAEVEERSSSGETLAGLTTAAQIFADIAKRDNERFDRERFMRACGLGGGSC